ncbi:MAG: hypothetical protein JXR46_00105 [Calditrichaceae bacterium]|nr:hypothetical protein [Calditrichaceae bacterium]MBN2707414.1 hypothetical protein [Calditrichaceae bacterium]RQV96953.1 MAG: hypothetical protein EH224_02910 [Calditrichota bacterium]
MKPGLSIAFFISSHGYGHAARCCAVIQSLSRLLPGWKYHIFTLVPEWFFKDSLNGIGYNYYPLKTDVGLVQQSPFTIDFAGTLQKLADFIPLDNKVIGAVKQKLERLNCKAVVCDISSLGIETGYRLNLPVFLLENFTWDWIYEFYRQARPGFIPYIDFFKETYRRISYRLQCQPVSAPVANSFICDPISREPRVEKEVIRRTLGIPEEARVILISTGGIAAKHHFVEKLQFLSDYYFIIPNDIAKPRRMANIIELPHHSSYYHPDLLNAADAVICKLGYSTIAETYRHNLPVLYISRRDFRESSIIQKFTDENLPSLEITSAEFQGTDWLEKIHALMQLKAQKKKQQNGAEQAARYIMSKII